MHKPQDLFIPILLATARDNRRSKNVALYVQAEAQKFGFQSELVDVKDHMIDRTTPSWQDPGPSKKWAEIMSKADGLIVVAPEYNHSFPGEFKIVFDQLDKEYFRKPIAICGVSTGNWGAVRMIEQMSLVAIAMGMFPSSKSLYFNNVKELFDEEGNIQNDRYEKSTKKFFEEILWLASALKSAREE